MRFSSPSCWIEQVIISRQPEKLSRRRVRRSSQWKAKIFQGYIKILKTNVFIGESKAFKFSPFSLFLPYLTVFNSSG